MLVEGPGRRDAFSCIGITSSVEATKTRNHEEDNPILLRAFVFSWPLMPLFTRLPLQAATIGGGSLVSEASNLASFTA
jgi:hypothetical protein